MVPAGLGTGINVTGTASLGTVPAAGQQRWPWGQSLLQDVRAEVALDVSRVRTGVLTGQNQTRAVPRDPPGAAPGGRGIFFLSPILSLLPGSGAGAGSEIWGALSSLGMLEVAAR